LGFHRANLFGKKKEAPRPDISGAIKGLNDAKESLYVVVFVILKRHSCSAWFHLLPISFHLREKRAAHLQRQVDADDAAIRQMMLAKNKNGTVLFHFYHFPVLGIVMFWEFSQILQGP
jgi:hypothetical protein